MVELDGDAGISGIHEVVLSGISEIGCIVSLIALILTIITYLIFNCWLRGVAFYVAFVAPVALMIILNFIVFGIVLRVIVGKAHKKLGRSDAHSTLRRLRRAVGVVILLGLTWVFGFMAVGEVKLIMQYLFVVFNSLQDKDL
nr:hypothetical protein BaRGS_017154 [Batillaria attramentaria]